MKESVDMIESVVKMRLYIMSMNVESGLVLHGFHNDSRLLVWVGVEAVAELLPIWWSGLSVHLYGYFGYGLTDISYSVCIRWVVSRLPSRSICRFIKCSGFCCSVFVFYRNCLFNIQWPRSACDVVGNIVRIGIHVFRVIYYSFAL